LSSRDKDSYSIHAVENALDVLEALCEENGDIQISRLSEKLGMNKTSVFRLLATFENRGYVEREEHSGRYRLGLSAYEIGQKLLSRMVVLRKARPVMERFVRDCDETLYLTIRRNREVLFMDMVDTTQQVKIVSLVGKRFPLEDTASGLVLLAHLAKEDDPSGTLSPSQRESLQRLGYASDTDSLGDGITSLAVPLFASNGSIAGGLCCVGPSFRLKPDKLEQELLPKLKDVGQTISSKLGYLGSYIGQRLT
jgi:IclR family transcriptional regulator, KDG regulon repressor